MRRFNAGAVLLSATWVGMSIAGCRDVATTSQPLRQPSNVADRDAVGPKQDVIILHGTRHRSTRYVIRDGQVTMDIGTGTTRTHAVTPEELAFLRRAGDLDQKFENLERMFRPVWKRMGLSEPGDVPDNNQVATTNGASGPPVAGPLAGADGKPGDVTSTTPRVHPGGGMHRTMIAADDPCWDDYSCVDDGGDLGGDSGSGSDSDRCINLFLWLWNAKNTLANDQQTLSNYQWDDAFYNCWPTPPNPLNIDKCHIIESYIAIYETKIWWDQQDQLAAADAIRTSGCPF